MWASEHSAPFMPFTKRQVSSKKHGVSVEQVAYLWWLPNLRSSLFMLCDQFWFRHIRFLFSGWITTVLLLLLFVAYDIMDITYSLLSTIWTVIFSDSYYYKNEFVYFLAYEILIELNGLRAQAKS